MVSLAQPPLCPLPSGCLGCSQLSAHAGCPSVPAGCDAGHHSLPWHLPHRPGDARHCHEGFPGRMYLHLHPLLPLRSRPRAWADKWRDGPPCVLYLTLQPAHPVSDPAHPTSDPAHPVSDPVPPTSDPAHPSPLPTRRGLSGAAPWQGQPHCSGREGQERFFWCLLHTDIRLFPFQGGLINFEKRRKVRAVPWQGGRRRLTWCKPRLCQSL